MAETFDELHRGTTRRPGKLTAERSFKYGRGFTIRDADGAYVHSLTFRDLQTLVCCRQGMARIGWHCRRSAYFSDHYLEPECDVFGVGYGTLSHLQHWGLLERPDAPGPLPLTEKGDQFLDLVLGIRGVQIPDLVMEGAA